MDFTHYQAITLRQIPSCGALKTKTDVVVPVVGGVVVAIGRATVARVVVPVPAPIDAVGAV